jgi:hypothetical protein
MDRRKPEHLGLTYLGIRPITGFSAKCDKCGSANVKIGDSLTDYGGWTGCSVAIDLECEDCKAVWSSDS